MTGDHMLAVILRRRMMHDTVKAFIKAQQPKSREEVTMLIREQRLGFMPLSFLHYAIWYLFLGYHALAFGFAVAGHPFEALTFMQDRKSDGSGKSVSVRVDVGGRRILKKHNTHV